MTQNDTRVIIPRLALRRLVVWANGKAVYDQKFKDGVNVIRGKNSSGKSTIADFIFYVLGGDFNKWKQEASQCDHVMAEVEINNVLLTLKRPISSSVRQWMMIFWGSYDQANASAVEGWKVFPFSRGKVGQKAEQKESFSQILFRELQFPELRGDLDNNISMHQVLRLFFVDQLSPVDSLLRLEQFDSALTRNTIGDLLLGVYDDELYASQLLMGKKQKELEAVTSEYENVLLVFGEAEQETSLEAINQQISEFDAQRKKVMAALRDAEKLANSPIENENKLTDLQNLLISKKQELGKLEEANQQLTFEVEDSQEFIKSLKARIIALDDSNLVRSLLGELPLTNCPHCLAPITPVIPGEQKCPLCKEILPEDGKDSHAARMHQELAQQIKESEFLLVKNQKELDQIRRKLPAISEEMKRIANEYENEISTAKSQRDEHLDKLWMLLGQLDTKIEFLHKHARGVAVLAHLKERKITLESEITRLGFGVRERIQKQEGRKIAAHSTIEQKALYLLHNDLPLEEAFKSASEIKYNFGTNNFAVNDENQFSASSMVYLKNSIHFAIFWASLELEFFRYPRIFICDDIEDKGMHPTRSQNFQRLLASLSDEFQVAHQIIFTTSMVDPELDKTELCVGPAYGPGNKTLKF